MIDLFEDFGDYAFDEDGSVKRKILVTGAIIPALLVGCVLLMPLFIYYISRRILKSKKLNTKKHQYLSLENGVETYYFTHDQYPHNLNLTSEELKEALDAFEKQRQFKTDIDKTLK